MLAAVDVFTEGTTFWVMEPIRLDLRLRLPGAPLMACAPVRDPIAEETVADVVEIVLAERLLKA